MALSRIDAIRKIAESTPNDPFPLYGLAMELKNLNRLDESHQEFEDLERRFPDYAAQYLMHHNVLLLLARKDLAKEVCLRGIAVCQKKGDTHALGEIQSALEAL